MFIVKKTGFVLAILLSSVFALDAQAYQNADLPDAMTFLNGKEVKTAHDWKARKGANLGLSARCFEGGGYQRSMS